MHNEKKKKKSAEPQGVLVQKVTLLVFAVHVD